MFTTLTHLLQVPTVDQTVNHSLSYARATADYGALVVIAGIFFIMVIAMFILMLSQVIGQRKDMREIMDFVRTSSLLLKEKALKGVTLDMARSIISNEMDKVRNEAVAEVIRIKQENNLSDRANVLKKATEAVNHMYSRSIFHLGKFEYDDKALSMYMESEWKNVVCNQMVIDCENSKFDISKLSKQYENMFNGFKTQFNSKLNW